MIYYVASYPIVSANGFVMLKNLPRFVLFRAIILFVETITINVSFERVRYG